MPAQKKGRPTHCDFGHAGINCDNKNVTGAAGISNCKMTQNKPSKEDQKTNFPYCWSKQEEYILNPGTGGTDLNYCLNYPRANEGYWVPKCHDVPAARREELLREEQSFQQMEDRITSGRFP